MINEVPDTSEKFPPKKIVYEENKKIDITNNNLKITNEKTTGITLIKKSPDKRQKIIKFKVEEKKNIEGTIFFIDKSKGRIKNKKGRRNKNSFLIKKSVHCNSCCDNMCKKIKSWTISSLIKFINKKILYTGDDNEKKKTKKKNILKLYTIKGTPTNKIVLQEYKDLLQKKMSEILSNDVSKKTKIKDKHNSILIEKIKKDNKYNNVNKILDLTFIDCINHFIGKEEIGSLKGFEDYYQEKINSPKINNKERFEQFVNNIDIFYSDEGFRKKMNNHKHNFK